MRTGKIKQLLAHYIAGSDRSYRELWPAGKFARLLWLAARRFTADRNSLRAVALTYYTLFAIVPMLALAFGIAKGFALQEKLQEILSEKLANQREILAWIYQFADSTLQQTQSGVIAGAGVIVLFWTVMWLANNVEKSFNAIWNLPAHGYFFRRLSDYLALILITPFLIVLLSSAAPVLRRIIGEGAGAGVLGALLYSLAVDLSPLVLIVLTFFTSIFPIISFGFETFLPNPGDYSFLYTGDPSNLTTKWWLTNENITENGMYGQMGILHNSTIWKAYGGTILVAVCCSLFAGTVGTMIGYAVSKNRRSKAANYVNSVAFLPYLMPSIAVGAAFFVLLSNQYFSLFNTYTILIIVGTIKYIPFASRSALNSMLQLSGEIEEAALIQNVPWVKRMLRIIIPIQKTSILSGYLLPFISCMRELSLFVLLAAPGSIITVVLQDFEVNGLTQISNGINFLIIMIVLLVQFITNKLTGASIDKGIGG